MASFTSEFELLLNALYVLQGESFLSGLSSWIGEIKLSLSSLRPEAVAEFRGYVW